MWRVSCNDTDSVVFWTTRRKLKGTWHIPKIWLFDDLVLRSVIGCTYYEGLFVGHNRPLLPLVGILWVYCVYLAVYFKYIVYVHFSCVIYKFFFSLVIICIRWSGLDSSYQSWKIPSPITRVWRDSWTNRTVNVLPLWTVRPWSFRTFWTFAT